MLFGKSSSKSGISYLACEVEVKIGPKTCLFDSLFSERELTFTSSLSLYAVARPSVFCLSSVCL